MTGKNIFGPSPGPGQQRNGSLDGLPLWARVVAVVGLPGAIAIYLVYVLATALPGKLEAHAAESKADAERTLRVLQQICQNTAETPEAKASCWAIGNR